MMHQTAASLIALGFEERAPEEILFRLSDSQHVKERRGKTDTGCAFGVQNLRLHHLSIQNERNLKVRPFSLLMEGLAVFGGRNHDSMV